MKLEVGRTYFIATTDRGGRLSDIMTLRFKGVTTMPDGRTRLAFDEHDEQAGMVERWINPSDADGWVLTRDELIETLRTARVETEANGASTIVDTHEVAAGHGDVNVHALERRVARALDEVVLDTCHVDMATTWERLDEIVATLGPEATDAAERLAIERCIEAQKLVEATRVRDAPALAEQAWQALEAIGHPNAAREADMLWYRATWLLDQDRHDDARAAISRLERIIADMPAQTCFRLHYQRMLDRLQLRLLRILFP